MTTLHMAHTTFRKVVMTVHDMQNDDVVEGHLPGAVPGGEVQQERKPEQEQEQRQKEERPLPTGLMMALAQNMRAMEHFAALSEVQRQRLIDAATQAHSQSQMQSLVTHMEQFMY